MEKLNRALVYCAFSSALVLSYPADGRDEAYGPNADLRTATAAADALFIITEVMYDPGFVDDTDGEWFEVYNPSNESINLNGLRFTDASFSSSNDFSVVGDLIIEGGQYAIFAQQSDLGNADYGINADYVWSDTGSFKLNNGSDTIHVYDDTLQIVEFAYNESAGWVAATGESLQLSDSLKRTDYQLDNTAWCLSTAPLAEGGDRATPGAANDSCEDVDVDGDGHWGEFDCDDADDTVNVDAIEVAGDDVDNDCDSIQLYSVLEDANDDSSFGSANELVGFSVGWDEEFLILGFDYAIEENAVIWYLETGVSGGEDDFHSGRGYGGAFPSDVTSTEDIDLMLGVYGDGQVYVYSISDGSSTGIVDSDLIAIHDANPIPGSAAPESAFVRLPWTAVYPSESGGVITGATIKIAGILRAGDNGAPADYAPNQNTSELLTFAEVRIDDDNDGEPDLGLYVDADGDGYAIVDGDCDDDDDSSYPDAPEVCDGRDNDCDELKDEGVTVDLYIDGDEDGYGTGDPLFPGCSASIGLSVNSDDCVDSDSSVYPGADEYCNNQDNDCDTAVDEDALDASQYYLDDDDDGYGDGDAGVQACEQPDGYVSGEGDCDDSNGDINPGATEVCDLDIDNDCNGVADDADSNVADPSNWYLDDDGDGYGSEDGLTTACVKPANYVEDGTDCDDSSEERYPTNDEVCGDTLDNDCDEVVDEDSAVDASTWYLDSDGDGSGDVNESVVACEAPGGYVADNADCADGNSDAYPGAVESCDGVDGDCDGTVDSPEPSDGNLYYADDDADGYGSDEVPPTLACEVPSEGNWSMIAGDCDDGLANVNPGAAEVPSDVDGLDENCDGEVETTPTPATPTPATGTEETPTEDDPGTPGEITPTPGQGTDPVGTEETPVEPTDTVADVSPTPAGETATTDDSTETEVTITPTEDGTEPLGTEQTPTLDPTETEVVLVTDPPATATPASTDPVAETSTPGETPTSEGGGEGCDCDTGSNPGKSGAASLLALVAVAAFRRRRGLSV